MQVTNLANRRQFLGERMKKYVVTVNFEATSIWIVEARNRKEAEEIARFDCLDNISDMDSQRAIVNIRLIKEVKNDHKKTRKY